MSARRRQRRGRCPDCGQGDLLLHGLARRPAPRHVKGLRHRIAHAAARALCEHRHVAATPCGLCLAAVHAAMIRRDGRRGRRDGLLERAYVLACRDGRVDEAATTLRDLIVAAEVTP